MVKPLNTVRSAFAGPAAVNVIDEQTFKKRADVVVNKMMDNAVPEIGGKNFSLHRLEQDKTDAAADPVISAFNFFA